MCDMQFFQALKLRQLWQQSSRQDELTGILGSLGASWRWCRASRALVLLDLKVDHNPAAYAESTCEIKVL